jgi:hypothetical protein
MNNLWLAFVIWMGCSQFVDQTTTSSSNLNQNEPKENSFDYNAEVARGVTINVAAESGSLLDRHKSLGKTPQNAIALWIEAAIRAQNGEAEGWNALRELTLPLRDESSWQSQGRNTYFVKALQEDNPVFRSFIVDATPENNYTVDLTNIRIRIAYENKRDSRGRKFMLISSGSSMPRPIYIQQSTKSKLFYVNEYSSMYVDVKPVVDPDVETFE